MNIKLKTENVENPDKNSKNKHKYSAKKRFNFTDKTDPERSFKAEIKGNIYIQYRDGAKPHLKNGTK